MNIGEVRVSNVPRDELSEIWKVGAEEFEKIISGCNRKEISLIFSHIPEAGVGWALNNLSSGGIKKVISSLSPELLNKVLLLSSVKFLSRLPSLLDEKSLVKVVGSVGGDVRSRIIKALPEDERKALLAVVDNEASLRKNYNYYTSDRYKKSLEEDAIVRIKELEEAERLLEKRFRAREEQLTAQLDEIRNQFVEAEREFSARKAKLKNVEVGLVKREADLKESIRVLQEEHQRQVQEKIELKVPEFVSSAVSVLEEKERKFSDDSRSWNFYGNLALGAAVVSAMAALGYGAHEFSKVSQGNIDWMFFCFLVLKGLILVGLFCAWGRHCYSIGNAYMHESLKRSDRVHAINFGKLYLEVYGNEVSQSDMKAIFENWNLDSDSAFTKVKSEPFEPKAVDQVVKLVKAVSDAGKGIGK